MKILKMGLPIIVLTLVVVGSCTLNVESSEKVLSEGFPIIFMDPTVDVEFYGNSNAYIPLSDGEWLYPLVFFSANPSSPSEGSFSTSSLHYHYIYTYWIYKDSGAGWERISQAAPIDLDNGATYITEINAGSAVATGDRLRIVIEGSVTVSPSLADNYTIDNPMGSSDFYYAGEYTVP